jgi:hypothetical protein
MLASDEILSKTDAFADAKLVEETRLYYSYILAGRYSEQFYVCFFKIIQKKIYLGYITLKGKKVQLKGILDFLYSKFYGLGIKNIDSFVLAISDQAVYDETESQYARQVLKWLKSESYLFTLPRKVYELERLYALIRYRRRLKQISQKEINLFIKLYNTNSEILPDIGEDRKYKTFEQAAVACGMIELTKKKNIGFLEEMNDEELKKAAKSVYQILDKDKSCRFVEHLLHFCEEIEPGSF